MILNEQISLNKIIVHLMLKKTFFLMIKKALNFLIYKSFFINKFFLLIILI